MKKFLGAPFIIWGGKADRSLAVGTQSAPSRITKIKGILPLTTNIANFFKIRTLTIDVCTLMIKSFIRMAEARALEMRFQVLVRCEAGRGRWLK